MSGADPPCGWVLYIADVVKLNRDRPVSLHPRLSVRAVASRNRQTRERQRSLVEAAVELLALAWSLDCIETACAQALDQDYDGYPTGSGHLAVHGSAPTDPTADTVLRRQTSSTQSHIRDLRRAIRSAAAAAADAADAAATATRAAP